MFEEAEKDALASLHLDFQSCIQQYENECYLKDCGGITEGMQSTTNILT